MLLKDKLIDKLNEIKDSSRTKEDIRLRMTDVINKICGFQEYENYVSVTCIDQIGLKARFRDEESDKWHVNRYLSKLGDRTAEEFPYECDSETAWKYCEVLEDES